MVISGFWQKDEALSDGITASRRLVQDRHFQVAVAAAAATAVDRVVGNRRMLRGTSYAMQQQQSFPSGLIIWAISSLVFRALKLSFGKRYKLVEKG